MPRRPQRVFQKRALSPAEVGYLSDDVTFEGDPHTLDHFVLFSYRTGQHALDGTPGPKELWEEYREDFLPAFIVKHPGRRPLGWWQWDCPRQADQGSGFWYEGTLPEPRRRIIGGKGELHKGYVPYSEYGIPQHWDETTLDANDPLTFESQAAYLERNNLLSESEKRYIMKHPELTEPEKVTFDGSED